MEKLAKLRPVFDRPVGKVTAGNSAQITDGAAWVMLASETWCPVITSASWDNSSTASGPDLIRHKWDWDPCYAMAPVMQRHGLDTPISIILKSTKPLPPRYWPAWPPGKMRIFAVMNWAVTPRSTAIDEERLNIDGGAVAVGHPVGSSGARIVLHMLKLLRTQ